MIDNVIRTPWKMWNRIASILTYPFVWLVFKLNRVSWGSEWAFFGIPIIQKHNNSTILIGSNLQLRSNCRANPIGINHPVILCTWRPGAEIKIGDNFGMSGGAIIAAQKIIIGNNVIVGANSTIIDTDFHPLDFDKRIIDSQNASPAHVIIEDNVFIGMDCIILKGVTIGKGSVIGAGSVVTNYIPPGVVVAGNPAKIIREL